MEPQPFGYGNDQTNTAGGTYGPSFNGATAFRLWKPCYRPQDFHRPRSFNGATAFRLWKPCTTWDVRTFSVTLQWSHSLSAMETTCQAYTTRRTVSFNGATAFRLWKPWGLGSLQRQQPCFNGATAFRLWKPVIPSTDHSNSAGASMEPQPFGYGNRLGRGLDTAHFGASMEPQPFGYGNFVPPQVDEGKRKRFNGATAFRLWKLAGDDAGRKIGLHASMEPQPFGYGNNALSQLTYQGPALQWSHSLSAMETSMTAVQSAGEVVLQWSHSLSAMETIQ